MKAKTIVVALGGNALIEEGTKGTIEEQFANTRKSMAAIVGLIKEGHHVVLSHGNGPQAGVHLVRNEVGSTNGAAPSPLNVIVADTQGSIGYMIQQSLHNALLKAGVKKDVVTVVTQVVVDKNDPSMKNPTKYVGLYFKEADLVACKDKGWVMKEDPGRGYRRVVASPIPVDVVEKETIHELLKSGKVVIAVGGGGVPVCRAADGTLEGVDAVIDKDRASALLASQIKADELVILTGVDKVAINFKKPDMKVLDKMTVAEAEKHLADKQFPAGSMGPKVEAAIDFIKLGGKLVVITSLEKAQAAVDGNEGTRIVP